MADPNLLPAYIHRFSYLRGIDGRFPSAAGGDEKSDSPDKTKAGSKGDAPLVAPRNSYAETPEGTNQSDYIRRLAFDLQQIDRRLAREGDDGIQAVGVLGSDLYDTLLILRALRDVLPHAIFFTTTLDARLANPTEWKAAHNLLVVSAYGLSLNPFYQRNIPPFRDSLQTATYAATLSATGILPDAAATNRWGQLRSQPRIFEIGRRGPRDLSVDDFAKKNLQTPLNVSLAGAYGPYGPGTLHPFRPDLSGWFTEHRVIWGIVLLVLAALASVLGFLIVHRLRKEPDGEEDAVGENSGKVMRSLLFLLNRAPTFYPLAVAILLTSLWVAYLNQIVEGEPLAMLDGVSAWPTIAIRFFSVALCFHLVARNHRISRKNDIDVWRTFFSKKGEAPLPKGGPVEITQLWKSNWKCIEGGNDEKVVNAKTLWEIYTVEGDLGHRLVRTIITTAVYVCVVCCVLQIFGWPHPPIRGGIARALDLTANVLLIVMGGFLTFFSIDAAILNRRFMDTLTQWKTDWPKFAYKQCRDRTLDEDDTNDLLDIWLIAKRTEVVGRLVYFPLLILLLLVCSHFGYFDNWDWPLGAVLVYLMTAVLSVLSAVLLRRAAERARKNALARLNDRWICYLGTGQDKADAVAQIIEEVRAEKRGAFSFLSQYPALAAILLPSGGLGIYVLIDYLLKNPF